MENVIFINSKGAQTRREIMHLFFYQRKSYHRFTITTLSEELEISKPAVKKHIDYLEKYGYIIKINPMGRPTFLQLSDKGIETARKYLFF